MKGEENGDRREGETEEGRRDGEEMNGREKQKKRQDGLMGGDSLHSIIPVDVQHPLSIISMSHGTHKLTHPCTQPTFLQHHPGWMVLLSMSTKKILARTANIWQTQN